MDNILWGAGITNMIPMDMKGAAPHQEARWKERDETDRLDGRGVEAPQHTDTMQEGEPEERRQHHF
jgi:hypothetical protein